MAIITHALAAALLLGAAAPTVDAVPIVRAPPQQLAQPITAVTSFVLEMVADTLGSTLQHRELSTVQQRRALQTRSTWDDLISEGTAQKLQDATDAFNAALNAAGNTDAAQECAQALQTAYPGDDPINDWMRDYPIIGAFIALDEEAERVSDGRQIDDPFTLKGVVDATRNIMGSDLTFSYEKDGLDQELRMEVSDEGAYRESCPDDFVYLSCLEDTFTLDVLLKRDSLTAGLPEEDMSSTTTIVGQGPLCAPKQCQDLGSASSEALDTYLATIMDTLNDDLGFSRKFEVQQLEVGMGLCGLPLWAIILLGAIVVGIVAAAVHQKWPQKAVMGLASCGLCPQHPGITTARPRLGTTGRGASRGRARIPTKVPLMAEAVPVGGTSHAVVSSVAAGTYQGLPVRELRCRAEALGVDATALSDARDSHDPITAIVELIVAAEQGNAAQVQRLNALSVGELRKLAAAKEGVSDEAIEAARDGDDPKGELIALLV